MNRARLSGRATMYIGVASIGTKMPMRFLAGVLSLLLNATIVAFAALLLLASTDEVDLHGIWSDGAWPSAPVPRGRVRAADAARSVVVHLFEWRWDDVAAECETFLGPTGFGAVQVSPPNEHRLVAGHPWWQRYEPVSWALTSRSGDAEAFADMVRRCADAGVAVYADAVINHMTGPALADDPAWGIGSAGSRYDYYEYPGLTPADFHAPRCDVGGRNGNRAAMQRCNAAGRADLDTEADRVQNRIGAYLNRLLALGVAGFRIDAAGHMAAGDIAGILARVDGLPFIYQAVAETPGGVVRGKEYLGNGTVTEPDYGRRLARAFRGGDIATLRHIRAGAEDLLPSHRALVFVDSHELRRRRSAGEGKAAVLTRRDGALYDLANVFMLAWPYGRPRVMSGYDFADAVAGPPAGEDGTTRRVHGPDRLGCGRGWTCEHRRPAVAGMVAFRNQTDGADVTNWWSDDENAGRIAFGRGDQGFVVINNTERPMRRWLRTGLPAGRYCNAVASRLVAGVCRALKPAEDAGTVRSDAGSAEAPQDASAPRLEISVRKDTSTTFEVPPRSAVALHAGLRPTADQAKP
jgi:alpha-amylase